MAHWKKRETVFAEYGLSVTMPGSWQVRPSGDSTRWIYRSADHREHLTISREDGLSPRNESDEAALLRRAVGRYRRSAELGFGRAPLLSVSEPEYGERVGSPAGWYHGTAGPGHEFVGLLVSREDAVWTLFYEGLKLRDQNAIEMAEEIFASISFEG